MSKIITTSYCSSNNQKLFIFYQGTPPSKNIVRQSYAGGKRWGPEVKTFRDIFKLESYASDNSQNIESFLKHWQEEKLLQITITYYMPYERGDLQNFTDHLSDGIQDFLGIDDKYYCIGYNPRKYRENPLTMIVIKFIKNTFKEERKRIKKEKNERKCKAKSS